MTACDIFDCGECDQLCDNIELNHPGCEALRDFYESFDLRKQFDADLADGSYEFVPGKTPEEDVFVWHFIPIGQEAKWKKIIDDAVVDVPDMDFPRKEIEESGRKFRESLKKK